MRPDVPDSPRSDTPSNAVWATCSRFFDHPNGANGPTEAINGRLETLRGIAFGFRNLDNYITRSLLHTGGFRQAIQTHL